MLYTYFVYRAESQSMCLHALLGVLHIFVYAVGASSVIKTDDLVLICGGVVKPAVEHVLDSSPYLHISSSQDTEVLVMRKEDLLEEKSNGDKLNIGEITQFLEHIPSEDSSASRKHRKNSHKKHHRNHRNHRGSSEHIQNNSHNDHNDHNEHNEHNEHNDHKRRKRATEIPDETEVGNNEDDSQSKKLSLFSHIEKHLVHIPENSIVEYEVLSNGYYCVAVPNDGSFVEVTFNEPLGQDIRSNYPNSLLYLRLAGISTLLLCMAIFMPETPSPFSVCWSRAAVCLILFNISQIGPRFDNEMLQQCALLLLCTLTTCLFLVATLNLESFCKEILATIWSVIFASVFLSESNVSNTSSAPIGDVKLVIIAVLLCMIELFAVYQYTHHNNSSITSALATSLTLLSLTSAIFLYLSTVDFCEPMLLNQFGFGLMFLFKEYINLLVLFGTAVTYAISSTTCNTVQRKYAAIELSV